ncbi:MAG: glutamine synthetase III [Victivallaceae bacterium]|nr:glutamine synthetase III [Victivallaceae bacterium]
MDSSQRIRAIGEIAAERGRVPVSGDFDLREEFGCDVFNRKAMQDFLSCEIIRRFDQVIEDGQAMPPEIATAVAEGMKNWAISRGATHYSHWFLPLTGFSAEKHDSFVEPDQKGGMLLKFSGKNLIMGEPDASSFPSGGLRSTFEARGYTAWDPTSPAFIRRGCDTATLCIPTAFCSYTGAVLDKKTPLLRSIQALSKQAVRLARCFGIEGKAAVTLGAEQEYFLIDKRLYFCRPDLIQTSRTLFGARPPKHQQLDDHYFGTIKPRILNFMAEADHELWRLGIPAKTRHNEAAPAQFELAPTFEELNLAVDHNMLVMEVLRQVADRHGLVCLLHEKPFEGINGSGKHNNWSLSVGEVNLLNPGRDPQQNALFMTTLAAVVQAVDRHGDLLRSSTIGAGNDHRLGAAEAPPAIISIFLGDQLTNIVEELIGSSGTHRKKEGELRIGVDTLPPLPCDATDRNRTSPFAFTGTKFEFRTPGASSSCAGPNIVLNTIVCEAFDEIATKLEALPENKFNASLQKLLGAIFKEHRRIIFNGDNYTAAWRAEAARRGLPNLPDTQSALTPMLVPENIALYEKYKVFSEAETRSRYEVFLGEYQRKVRIEAELTLLMARTVIYPAVIEQLHTLGETYTMYEKSRLTVAAGTAREMIDRIAPKLAAMLDECVRLESALGTANCREMLHAMGCLRSEADALELLVDDALWPLPKYREMLFVY